MILYPVSEINFPSPERGVICISIVDLISKSSLILIALFSASKDHVKNNTVVFDHIQYMTIHGGFLVIVILQ